MAGMTLSGILGGLLFLSIFLTRFGLFRSEAAPWEEEAAKPPRHVRYLAACGNLPAFLVGKLKRGQEGREEQEKRAVRFGRALLILWLFCLTGALYASTRSRVSVQEIERAEQGGGETSHELIAVDENGTEMPVTITVGERELSEEEREALLSRAMEEADAGLFYPGDDADQVRHDLNFPLSLCDGAVKLFWLTQDPSLVGYGGTVYNRDLPEEGELCWVSARFYCESGMVERTWYLHLLPPLLTPEQAGQQAFLRFLKETEENSRKNGHFTLPGSYEGHELTFYPYEEEVPEAAFPFLGVALAALVTVMGKEKEKEELERRKRQMRRDYPEILMKECVLLGAGLTPSGALSRLTGNYRKEREKRGVRYAYEGLIRAEARIRSGVPEEEAYLAFGRESGLHGYLKFMNLLGRSIRTGSRGLLIQLQEEASEALREQKNDALRRGEEAGMSMLLPMLLLLLVILILIMAPAMQSMSVA